MTSCLLCLSSIFVKTTAQLGLSVGVTRTLIWCQLKYEKLEANPQGPFRSHSIRIILKFRRLVGSASSGARTVEGRLAARKDGRRRYDEDRPRLSRRYDAGVSLYDTGPLRRHIAKRWPRGRRHGGGSTTPLAPGPRARLSGAGKDSRAREMKGDG